MSIEIESEFSVIKIKGEKYLQTVLLTTEAAAAETGTEVRAETETVQTTFCDRGISYIRSDRMISDLNADYDEDDAIHAKYSLKEIDELIEFRKDPDYEDDVCEFEDLSACNGYDSLLPYDYETDIVDALNLDEQIAMYAANSWEFVSINDNIILFQRPKWEA
ncbi:hypothetical protein MmiHf6_07470 [Methanimicrococcus hongohii]|uniref:Uncharacterized protein n=1 Tax=Methanimicrococcus hongohii TaxID=3028295 RepID=A0AA96UZZ1_9EURY|nr:hypothetical protein [Methanimicrococcus sp. Hf6]WNY23440.1 hypothetical protein MmiHf6_07470 [Methanimicrococcus sp. Hf6]